MKPTPPQTPQQQQECHLDELGYCFVKKCVQTIESRGLDDQGLYRIGGVNSRVARLLQLCLDRKNYNQLTGQITMPDFSDPVEWETKTITSALKNYLRNLSEPLMTYYLHPTIIEAAKIENPQSRSLKIKTLIQQLPIENFTLLKILVEHLKNVASHSQKNLMTVSNLGICFAPTLMRGPDESALSIMEIKYSNVVANTLIEDFDSIFNDVRMINQSPSNKLAYHNQQQTSKNQNNHLNLQHRLPPPPLPPLPPPQPQLSYQATTTNNTNNNNIQQGQQTRFSQPAIQVDNNNHQDDRLGLELRDLNRYHSSNSLTKLNNNNNNSNNNINNNHNSQLQQDNQHQQQQPVKCQNGSNDLAKFALKSYDHTSRPTQPTSFISSSIPPIDIRPINDINICSYEQTTMVPPEQPYHSHIPQQLHSHPHQQHPSHQLSHQYRQQLGGSMNNSLNYIGYPSSQTSSHPNSLNYSTNSLNNGLLGDQFNNPIPMHSLQYYPMSINKLTYRSTKALTLYACQADTATELSFGPNELVINVRHSAEVGWLVGTLERTGVTGLLPENYVKFI